VVKERIGERETAGEWEGETGNASNKRGQFPKEDSFADIPENLV